MNLRFPTNYVAITMYYNPNTHRGIDLAWNSKQGGKEVPIFAPADGVVTVVKNDYATTDLTGSSYGNYVRIDHGNGICTLMAHLKQGSVSVKVGDRVTQGQQVGNMGNTGRSNGNHTHYEVFVNGNKVNPLDYTYAYPYHTVHTDDINKVKYYNESTTVPPEKEIVTVIDDTKIKELEQKIDELNKIISTKDSIIEEQNSSLENLKASTSQDYKELQELKKYKFKYDVEKDGNYKIRLNEGETMIIK